MSRLQRLVDPSERKEQRQVLKPLALLTVVHDSVYQTILCTHPNCSKLAVATSDPESRLCEDHA